MALLLPQPGTSPASEARLRMVAESVAVPRAGVAPMSVTMTVPVRHIATFHGRSPRALVMALPTLCALRESFPGAKICAWLRPGLAALLQDSPVVDEVHWRPHSVSQQAALMARLHTGAWDMALCFGMSRNAALLTWATGAPVRAGFSPSRSEALFSHRVPVTRAEAGDGSPTPIDHLELARAVGCRVPAAGCDPRELIGATPAALARADRALETAGIGNKFVLVAGERSKMAGKKNEQEGAFWHEVVKATARCSPIALLTNAPSPARFALEEYLPPAPESSAQAGHRVAVLGASRPYSTRGALNVPMLQGVTRSGSDRLDWGMIAALGTRAQAFVGAPEGEITWLCAALGTPVVIVAMNRAQTAAPLLPPALACRRVHSPTEIGLALAELAVR